MYNASGDERDMSGSPHAETRQWADQAIVLHVPVAGVSQSGYCLYRFTPLLLPCSEGRGCKLACKQRADAESAEDETMNDAPWAT